MAKIKIDREKCKGCLLCVSVCPKNLIRLDDRLNKMGLKPVKFKDNSNNCIGCCACALVCPDVCIEVFK